MSTTKKKPGATSPSVGTTQALAKVSPEGTVTMFERLAKDPSVPVEKLLQLIELQERIQAFNAKAAFNAAFSAMQGAVPVIEKNGEVDFTHDGKRTHFKFATHADIQRAVRPILALHGFTIRHRNEYTPDGKMMIVGILAHRDGHSEQDTFIASADPSGGKNAIQAVASTREYGRRYTTCALLWITTEDVDDDGEGSAPRAPEPQQAARPTSGYHDTSDEPITDFTKTVDGRKKVGQLQRLHMIAKSAGRDPATVKAWLAVAYNVTSSKQIKRRDYDDICKAIEAPGPLGVGGREPGQEG